jgi:benzoyl-CoA reductase subunit A
MKCVVGIDLGSTTTKAVLLDEDGNLVGRGITNSRSNYDVASGVARDEAITSARFTLLDRKLDAVAARHTGHDWTLLRATLLGQFRLALYMDQLNHLEVEVHKLLDATHNKAHRDRLTPLSVQVLAECFEGAAGLFVAGAERRSDFFRDLAGAAFMASAERRAGSGDVDFERLAAVFDRAIFNVEAQRLKYEFADILRRALDGTSALCPDAPKDDLGDLVDAVGGFPIEEIAFVGTGYGRQTLPFPAAAVRSEILCHGRGAHSVFNQTRTVLDIGGQDTKAIQVDETGVVTSFQMNDRCAAGCGRYLGYIADELGLGLHELGPLALKARKVVRVNSTCTVFAGAELRERLALGQAREDVLAGLHRAIILRAMSLLARSGGVENEFTFTGGVCKNPMATRILGELVNEHYGDITLNAHPDSIYMGALGAGLFALDDLRRGTPQLLTSTTQEEPCPTMHHACT